MVIKSKKNKHIKPVGIDAKARIAMKQNLEQAQYVVYDLETTGGNPSNNRITEIAAFKIYNGMVIDSFYSLVNPKMNIPPIVRRITGLTNDMLKDSPPIEEIMPQFFSFIQGSILVSHNATTDIQFVKYYSEKVLKKNIDNFYLCTQKLGEKFFPDTTSRSLKGFCEYLGLPSMDFHRAEDDARATQFVFMKILDAVVGRGLKSIEDVIRIQGDLGTNMRLGSRLKDSSIAVVPAKAGVLIFKNADGEVVFVTASENMLQDLKKLKSAKQLPKQLLKIILEVKDFEHISHESFFAAMMMESQLIKDYKISFHPSKWHLRCISALSFVEENDKVKLVCQPITQNPFGVNFGPIHDQSKVMAAISRALQVGQVNAQFSKNIIVSKSTSEALRMLLEHFSTPLNYTRHFWNLIWRPSYRSLWLASGKTIGKFKLFNLGSYRGVIVFKYELQNVWDVYKIENSCIVGTSRLSHSPLDQKGKIRSDIEWVRIDPIDSNVFLWWYFRQRFYDKKSNVQFVKE